MLNLERIDHVALSVKDVQASAAWYKDIMGLEHYYEGEWDGVPHMIGKGGTCIALFGVKGENPQQPASGSVTMLHLAFKTDRTNFEDAKNQLKERQIEFEFSDHKISHSIYFNDPDGHQLEITTYEI